MAVIVVPIGPLKEARQTLSKSRGIQTKMLHGNIVKMGNPWVWGGGWGWVWVGGGRLGEGGGGEKAFCCERDKY